jgi:transposase InsO family protein
MDFIMDSPVSNGFNAVLTIVDKLTKYAHFIPCKTSINEVETAKLFHDHIWTHFGLPRQVITDRDARWTGAFWEHLTSKIGIKRSLTTTYHPQAGQSEIMNQILEIALRAYVAPSRDDWSSLLPAFTLHTILLFTLLLALLLLISCVVLNLSSLLTCYLRLLYISIALRLKVLVLKSLLME